MYHFHTDPFKHQLDEWKASRGFRAYAAFWEQGTGKSKFHIDTTGYLWSEKEITAAIVVAPNGVHRNWITDELPTHMPPSIPLEAFAFKGESSSAKWHQKKIRDLVGFDGLAFLAISYDAWMTKAGKQAVWDIMRKRPTILGLDECHRIKTPSAKRTQSILQGGKHAKYRRVMSGTPVSNGPFDIYSQIKFLDPLFWRRELEIDSFTSFKAFFGIFEKGWNQHLNNGEGGEYDSLVGYQNLDELAKAIKGISSRITKDEVLDLPEKLYTKRYYEMAPEQRRIYEEVEKEFMAWLESGELVTAELAITRMLRLQQVLCGYIPVDGEKEPRELIDRANNPRIKLLKETMEDVNGKTIIWARWTRDIDMIMEVLKADGRNPVRYDGQVSGDARQRAKDAFKKGDATDFVANSQMSEGLTLNEATTTIYYNNSYKLVDRQQTEDRNHRIGQTNHVTYVDLICPGTRDEHVIDALIAKLDVAAVILGDQRKIGL